MIQSTTDNDSIIKDNVKTWYNNNISSYDSYLEDMNLCFNLKGSTSYTAATFSDIIVSGVGTTYYFESYARSLLDLSYNCSDGITIISKYGLVSMDEVCYGGAVKVSGTYNNTFWMIDTNNHYWALSPAIVYYSGAIYAANVYTDGYININLDGTITQGVCPTLSLFSNVVKTGGDGKIDTPYTVVLG